MYKTIKRYEHSPEYIGDKKALNRMVKSWNEAIVSGMLRIISGELSRKNSGELASQGKRASKKRNIPNSPKIRKMKE